jgi:hypothetical protein
MQLHALSNARDQADILKSGSAAILSSKQTRALTFENLFLYFFCQHMARLRLRVKAEQQADILKSDPHTHMHTHTQHTRRLMSI